MINSDPQQTLKTQRLAGPAVPLAMLAVGLLVLVGIASAALFDNVATPLAVFLVISVFALRGVLLNYPHDTLGFCNVVTLIRAAMISVLCAAIIEPASESWWVFLIALAAFALDGLDGWLARRSGLSSAFGARFDMEIDALLGAVLALILLAGGRVGPEILILGFARYAFVAASILLPKLRRTLPENFRRKAICVIQIAALIVLLCPLTPPWLMYPVLLGASLLLLWSFAADTWFLLRRAE
ncbi:CDP-alcohol phosphatidyltransferase family protein [Litoreibacter arenae]|uniref:CDP-diacylglycerol--glycerol-3-phosphate 3-phosphatidyltransferase n=1 Tax=Litoreibacter arenae DSM 19593 TaxID=1123360 RepID=S9QBX6_9RHOB|nr:CDP-alcohol phosphatidyltransferase family protein [Litoreibacter arenae]EPX77083.1 CDP-diacylglycerol--glycerol-3-phosphate 3-phosphatidyltransferase [Litoreibacter arenae DSM 19593]